MKIKYRILNFFSFLLEVALGKSAMLYLALVFVRTSEMLTYYNNQAWM